MRNKIKYIIATAIGLFLGLLTLLGPLSPRVEAKGILAPGSYEVPVDKDLPMGGNSFSNTAIVEVSNNFDYYLTFSIVDKESISRMSIVKGEDKVGEIIKRDGKRIDYTYTLCEEDLKAPLTFRAFIVAMQAEKEFKVTLHLDKAIKLSDFIADLGERPALFVPKILLAAGDSEMKLGSFYQLESARAIISGEELEVEARAYYLKNGEKQEIEIENNRFMLENVGEYHVIYRASTDKYKTSLGNPSFTEADIKIICKANATSLARVRNIEGRNTLPEMISVQAIKLDTTLDSFKDTADKLRGISNNYEAISLTIYDIDGNIIKPSEEIELYLYANPRFDRTKARVYHLEDNGELKPIEATGYGRYMKMETGDTGTFIIYVPGVPFVMPMWGYACILGGALLILAGAIATTVIVVRKKKKRNITRD